MTGRTARALAAVMVRFATVLRVTHLGYLVVFVGIWSGWYRGHPLAMLGPAAAVAWGVLGLADLRRAGGPVGVGGPTPAPRRAGAAGEVGPGWAGAVAGRPIRRGLVLGDVALAAGLALTAFGTTPDPVRGDPTSFVFVSLLVAVVAAAEALPPGGYAMVLAVLVAAQLAGAERHRPQVFGASAILVVIGVLLRHAFSRLRAVAVQADGWRQAAV